MRCANVADTGSLKVLFGLIKLDNPLTLLQAVYPTEKNTAVYWTASWTGYGYLEQMGWCCRFLWKLR